MTKSDSTYQGWHIWTQRVFAGAKGFAVAMLAAVAGFLMQTDGSATLVLLLH
jgi:hypothetical protein